MSQYYFKPSVHKDRIQVAFYPTMEVYDWMMELKSTVMGMTPSATAEAAIAYSRANEKEFIAYCLNNILDAYILRQKKAGRPVAARLPCDAINFVRELKAKFPSRMTNRLICSLAVCYAHSQKEDFLKRSTTSLHDVLERE